MPVKSFADAVLMLFSFDPEQDSRNPKFYYENDTSQNSIFSKLSLASFVKGADGLSPARRSRILSGQNHHPSTHIECRDSNREKAQEYV